MKKTIISLTTTLILFACNQTKEKTEINANCCQKSDYTGQAVLWYQHSPEMKALYIQSYNMAKMALVNNLHHKLFPGKKNCVVVDIDETILSNSPYQAWLYLTNGVYTEASWNEWVKNVKAEPLPGTVDFLNYAKSIGVEIFYLSNRNNDELFEPTLQNLKKYNLPNADKAHLLLKTKGDTTLTGRTTKEHRRLKIQNELNYEILLLCGDQVADFDKAFTVSKDGTEQQIKDSVDKYKTDFSTRFIIIPNPMYCDWLRPIITGNDKDTTCVHQDLVRRKKATTWK